MSFRAGSFRAAPQNQSMPAQGFSAGGVLPVTQPSMTRSTPMTNFNAMAAAAPTWQSGPARYPQGSMNYQSIPMSPGPMNYQSMSMSPGPMTYQSMSMNPTVGVDVNRDGIPDFNQRPMTSMGPVAQAPPAWIPNEAKGKDKFPPAGNAPQRDQNFWSTEDAVMKREQAAQHLCHLKEEILNERITFVENILFRSMDLPAHDVKYANELIEEEEELEAAERKKEEDDHDHDFQRHYAGPFGTTDDKPEEGWFVDTLRACKDYELHHWKEKEYEHWRKAHPLTCALAGQWGYLDRFVHNLDKKKPKPGI